MTTRVSSSPKTPLPKTPLQDQKRAKKGKTEKVHFDKLVIESSFPSVCCRIFQTYLRSQPLTLESASEIMNMRPRTLQRRFHKAHTTFSEVLAEARLAIAKEMLDDPHLPIIEVAQHLGYETHSNFSRAFRRITGISPQEYRKSQ